MKSILILISLFIIIPFFTVEAQITPVKGGIHLGLGSVKGNSPSTFSYTGSVQFDFRLDFFDPFNFRISYLYARDFDILIPEDRQGRYYPYVQGFTLQGESGQYLSERVFIEGGAGLLYLQDRTFGDVDSWNIGTVFNIALAVELFDYRKSDSGFILGAGIEYGITFTDTQPQYQSNHISIYYSF